MNISPALAAALGNTTGKGNRTDQYEDYGFDLGGPLLQRSDLGLGHDGEDQHQPADADRRLRQDDVQELRAQGRRPGDQERSAATSPSTRTTRSRTAATSARRVRRKRRGTRPARPSTTRARATSSSARGCSRRPRYAHVDGGFQLAPVGGLATDYYIDDGGVAHNTFYQYQSTRPQDYIGGDANYFAGRHEVKFGGAWRSTPVDHRPDLAGEPPDRHAGTATRTCSSRWRATIQASTDAKYFNGFVTDTISLDRLTLIGGVRFDHQESSLGDASVPGVARHPDPAGAERARRWRASTSGTTSRRASASPTPSTTQRKTIVRGSYAMFASQLPGDEAKFVSPIQYSYAYYNAVDRTATASRRSARSCSTRGCRATTGFDPTDPARLSTVNTVDANVKAPITHELLFGVDREIVPNFARQRDVHLPPHADLTCGVRRPASTLVRLHRRPARSTGTLAELGTFSVPLYALRAAAVPPAAARPRPTGPATTSATGASSSAPPSGCRTAGWRGSDSRPTTGASTSTIRRCRSSIRPTPAPAIACRTGRSPARSSTAAWSCRKVERQRQEQHLTWSRRSTRSSPTAPIRGRGGSTSAATW